MRAFVRATVPIVIAAVIAIVGFQPAQAQQTGTITGRVIDDGTMQPLASAQVSVANLSIGVLTQQNGRFVLLNVPAGSHVVAVQRIGYQPQEGSVTVTAGGSATIDFELSQEALALDEIIVTGTPGGTQRRAIGNVVTRVDASSVTDRQPVTNMQELLASRAPGLDFMRQTGNIGTGSEIRIRGVNSFNLDSQPLIFVDGIRVDNSADKGPNLMGRGEGSSALDEINPNDIASIEVIKGPAAATLYGTEASAGVIQIITKKGLAGAPQFDFTVTQGTNFMMDPAGKIGTQYACSIRARPCPEDQLFTFNLYDIEQERGNDVFQYGYNQGYSLGVRGGTDAIRYYLSGDWDDQEGILDYNTDDRKSIRANVGVLISEGLNLDVSTGYVTGDTRYLEGTNESGDVWDQLMWAQGAFLEGPTRGYLNYTPEQLATIETTRQYKRFTGSATMTHNPWEWLTQRLIVGTDFASDENQSLIPRHPDGAAGTFRSKSLGEVDIQRPQNTEFTFDYSASARYNLMDLGLTSSFGAQYYSTEYNSLNSTGLIFASPAIRSIEGATSTVTGQDFLQNKSLGFYVQQEANINDRIYLTGAIRMDDNSAFGSNFDAAIYPKLSAAWVVSEEPFFQNQTFVDQLRLRAAWGRAGRQPSTFAAVTLFDPYVGPGGAAAVTTGDFGNADIGPEVGEEIEVGFETALLDNRATIDFTYYYQKITDALGDVPLAPSRGFSGSQEGNIARLDNWGWEAIVNLDLIRRENLAFNLGLTGTHTLNRIKDLGPRAPTSTVRVGFPYPIFATDVITSAEFGANGLPTNVMCDQGIGYLDESIPGGPDVPAKPGGISVPCAETEAYALYMGTEYPQYVWSAAPSLTLFRNLEVFGLIDAEFGRWGSDAAAYCRHTLCFSNTRASQVLDDPTYVEGVLFSSRHPTDARRYVYYDGDFMKLREVGARYQIPESLTGRFGVDRASLAVTGRNLATLWQRQKDIDGAIIADPESTDDAGGFSLFQWPGLSSVTAALRVTF